MAGPDAPGGGDPGGETGPRLVAERAIWASLGLADRMGAARDGVTALGRGCSGFGRYTSFFGTTLWSDVPAWGGRSFLFWRFSSGSG